MYIDEEDSSSAEYSGNSHSPVSTTNRNQARASKVALNAGPRGSATTVVKSPKSSRVKELEEPSQQLSLLPSDMLRTISPTHSPHPTHLYRTVHLMSGQAIPEQGLTCTIQNDTMPSVQTLR